MTRRVVEAIPLVSGDAEGPSFVLREPLSFWGGLEASSGRIMDRWHSQNGEVLSGRVLVMEAGRGSSSGSSVLAEAIRLGTGPLGIVLLARDAIVTVGAMVAAELYGKHCPVLLAGNADWSAIISATYLRLAADAEAATIAISR